jgi:hypothetical protein
MVKRRSGILGYILYEGHEEGKELIVLALVVALVLELSFGTAEAEDEFEAEADGLPPTVR